MAEQFLYAMDVDYGGEVVLGPGGASGNTPITVAGGATFAANPGGTSVSAGLTGAGIGGGGRYPPNRFDAQRKQYRDLQPPTGGPIFGHGPKVSGAKLEFAVSSTAGQIVVNTGAASVAGTNTIAIQPVGTSLPLGKTFTLISAPTKFKGTGTFEFANGTTTESLTVGAYTYGLTLANPSPYTAETLTVGPFPVTQNPSSETVAPNGTATFTAAATGTPTPTVQWYVSTNGGGTFTSISGATSTTYSFTASAGQSGNEYEAEFTNSAGSVYTTAATLTVGAPVVTTQPSNWSGSSGGNASFSAAASGTPSPTVQWYVSSNSGTSFSAISGATSTTYSFTANTGESGNEYKACFTNSVGSVYTTARTLTVSGIPDGHLEPGQPGDCFCGRNGDPHGGGRRQSQPYRAVEI